MLAMHKSIKVLQQNNYYNLRKNMKKFSFSKVFVISKKEMFIQNSSNETKAYLEGRDGITKNKSTKNKSMSA